MRNIYDIKKVLEENKLALKRSFKVRELCVFGSYVRGEQKENSDIDILVEFSEPVGFFTFLDLEEHLSQLLDVKVDLVSKKALKPRIGRHILQEMIQI